MITTGQLFNWINFQMSINIKMKNIFILILLGSILSCKTQHEEKTVEEVIPASVSVSEDQVKNAGIELGHTEIRMLSAVLKLQGKIDVPPQNMVSVSFPLGGYLKSTRLLPGMHVSKGDVLAVLEDMQFIQLQQDYLIAKARLSMAEDEFLRQQDLNTTKTASDKIFRQARTEFETQKILTRALEEKLKLLGINVGNLNETNLSNSVAIHSPINGFVSKINVNMGKYTSPTDVLFELVNPSDIHLNLTVFEKDIEQLSIGQKIIAYTNDKPDQKHAGDIILVSKNIDENRAAEVHCHFDKYDRSLLPGMFMNAEIMVSNKKATAVPEGAIVSWQNSDYIFVAREKNNFEMKEVETGVKQQGWVEILAKDNLEGKQVVIKNAFALLMKMKNNNED
jgi:cobalt-zinc-cadmium efflux system membrane fusion protein